MAQRDFFWACKVIESVSLPIHVDPARRVIELFYAKYPRHTQGEGYLHHLLDQKVMKFNPEEFHLMEHNKLN